jgi:hypothetical protein
MTVSVSGEVLVVSVGTLESVTWKTTLLAVVADADRVPESRPLALTVRLSGSPVADQL